MLLVAPPFRARLSTVLAATLSRRAACLTKGGRRALPRRLLLNRHRRLHDYPVTQPHVWDKHREGERKHPCLPSTWDHSPHPLPPASLPLWHLGSHFLPSPPPTTFQHLPLPPIPCTTHHISGTTILVNTLTPFLPLYCQSERAPSRRHARARMRATFFASRLRAPFACTFRAYRTHRALPPSCRAATAAHYAAVRASICSTPQMAAIAALPAFFFALRLLSLLHLTRAPCAACFEHGWCI